MYRENKITKLRLTEEINEEVLKRMESTIEKLVYYLELYAMNPFRNEVSVKVFKNKQQIYQNS